MPPLHGKILYAEDGHSRWAGEFEWLTGSSMWGFGYIDENDDIVPQLTGRGETPKQAFDECVARFIHLNNGEESPNLRVLLSRSDEIFNPDGGVRLGYLLG